ncbi:uncharacterized protein FIBRA_03430 [Fibroporia radiculosa]|uniref:Uncharacterized protein n=1 Tax=Fibroporia radiculosa TaxID=599839 RepID=J4GNH1_9APHY|nr:uncharacterized protein FIBRA_03430 [Fibroporia radiculosa]CCM01380.1 predicted protein [Fibroporia radiculosa]
MTAAYSVAQPVRCMALTDVPMRDVDLIVFCGENPERLKAVLTEVDEDFYLVPSRSRTADYEVLWCALPTEDEDTPRGCKVDILVPGLLEIPDIPTEHIEDRDGLPVMPLLPLLMMKLKGWFDHRNSSRPDMRDKQVVDVVDIDELLAISCDYSTHIRNDELWWLPEDFITTTQDRVYEYVEDFPDSALYWQNLGFQPF